MKAMAMIGAGLLVGALLVGCAEGGFQPQVPTSNPDLRGVVTSIAWGDDANASARVVWTDDPAVGAKAGYDAAQVAIVKGTDIQRKVDGGYEPASDAELKVGTIVEVWFTGAVAESYPVQATAATVAIVGVYDGELPVPPGLGP